MRTLENELINPTQYAVRIQRYDTSVNSGGGGSITHTDPLDELEKSAHVPPVTVQGLVERHGRRTTVEQDRSRSGVISMLATIL
jgi:hypothetical protein